MYLVSFENFIEKTANIHLYIHTLVYSKYQGISRDFEGKLSDPHLGERAAGLQERELPRKRARDGPKSLSLHQDH